MKKPAALLWLLIAAVSLTAQSPWTLPQKGYYLQLSYGLIPAYNSLFGRGGEPFSTSRKITDHTIQFFGEYGISGNLTVQLRLPYKILSSGDLNPEFEGNAGEIPAAGSHMSFGNGGVGFKYRLTASAWASAVYLSYDAPAPGKDQETALLTGYPVHAFSPGFSAGRGWEKFYTWFRAGTRLHTGGYSDYITAAAEGGYLISRGLYLIGYLDLYESLRNGSVPIPTDPERFGLYANNQEHFSFGVKLLKQWKTNSGDRFGMVAGGAGSFYAFDLPHAPYLNLGLFYKTGP